jgi:hypothetical protein
MADVALFIAALFITALAGSALITAILYGLCWRWHPSYTKAITVSVIAALLAVFLSAFGAADGGPLNFRAAPLFLAAQAVILAFDLIRIRRKRVAALTKGEA